MSLSTVNISKTLVNKFKANELGAFYIFSAHDLPALHSFLSKFLHDLGLKGKEQIHSDLMWLKTEEKQFAVQDFSEVFKYCQYLPDLLQYKLVIIDHAEKLGPICANKILKILEEPIEKVLFILLHEKGTNILSTINSRAIKINIDSSNESGPSNKLNLEEIVHRNLIKYCPEANTEELKEEFLEFIQAPRQKDAFLNSLHSETDLEMAIYQSCLDYLSKPSSNTNPAIFKRLEEYERAKLVHGPKEARLLPLLQETFNIN